MPYARYFPFAPPSQLPTLLPLASGWIRPMGDPRKELRGREENRGQGVFPLASNAVSSQSHRLALSLQRRPQPTCTATSPVSKNCCFPRPFRPKDGNGSLLLLAPGYCNI